MIDIWGRPLSSAEKPTTKTQGIEDVKKIIEDEIAETLNLASVDPGEIVIFQDRQGKLKSSNVSLDDILIRRRDAADNSIALFQDGKLKPGVLASTITDTLANYDKEFDKHVKDYNQFRKNVINKFFGTPITVVPSLAEIKTFINVQREENEKIFILTRQLENIKKDVTIIKNDLPRLEKVKIPHTQFSNIVYTRKSGTLEWTPTNNVILVNSTVAGIHRLTLVSQKQFNISSLGSTGTNNVISTVIEKDATVQFTITPIDTSIQNASLVWYVEFVAEMN